MFQDLSQDYTSFNKVKLSHLTRDVVRGHWCDFNLFLFIHTSFDRFDVVVEIEIVAKAGSLWIQVALGQQGELFIVQTNWFGETTIKLEWKMWRKRKLIIKSYLGNHEYNLCICIWPLSSNIAIWHFLTTLIKSC